MFNFKKAFTLAEVLITLGIIGIVAALTMPALVTSYKKHQTITVLKREYAVLLQMTANSQVENGDIAGWNWSLGLNDFVNTYFLPYLKVIKDCKTTGTGCWLPDNKIYAPNGSTIETISNSTFYKVVLSNGAYLAFIKQDNKHLHFYLDTNGQKSPNTYGIDSFIFTFAKEAFVEGANHNISHSGLWLYNQGKPNQSLDCKKTSSTGTDCGALYQQSGWQIPDNVNLF